MSDTKPSAIGGHFLTTQWSEVGRAAHPDPAVRREALGRLLTKYLPALRAHLAAKSIPADRAEDLLQGFVCDHVIAQQLLARVDRARGRFRSFIAMALDGYVVDVFRRENAAKRRPVLRARPIEALAQEPPDQGVSPTDAFDAEWARQVLAEAVEGMRRECQPPDRQVYWEVFRVRVLAPIFEGAPPLPYQQLVERYGFRSPAHASNVLVTGRRMFARILRGVIAEYAATEDEQEQEMKHLWQICSRCPPVASPPGTSEGSAINRS